MKVYTGINTFFDCSKYDIRFSNSADPEEDYFSFDIVPSSGDIVTLEGDAGEMKLVLKEMEAAVHSCIQQLDAHVRGKVQPPTVKGKDEDVQGS